MGSGLEQPASSTAENASAVMAAATAMNFFFIDTPIVSNPRLLRRPSLWPASRFFTLMH